MPQILRGKELGRFDERLTALGIDRQQCMMTKDGYRIKQWWYRRAITEKQMSDMNELNKEIVEAIALKKRR